LDELDARFGAFDSELFTNDISSQVCDRAKALRTRLEAVNAELYQSVRSEIVRTGQPRTLLQWLRSLASQKEFEGPLPGFGFDTLDELVSGILQLREPSELKFQPSPEMVFYQPTPVRHILDMISVAMLSEDDTLVDLGSGFGHVPLLVSLLTGIRSLGIEVQSTYVASAQECARSLRLGHARFVSGDARVADFSGGTVFYLYSPFTGSILTDVLNMLREESTSRAIKVCSLGPCTGTIANETWLQPNTLLDTERITVFESQ
jgi:predicted RNA methylase